MMHLLPTVIRSGKRSLSIEKAWIFSHFQNCRSKWSCGTQSVIQPVVQRLHTSDAVIRHSMMLSQQWRRPRRNLLLFSAMQSSTSDHEGQKDEKNKGPHMHETHTSEDIQRLLVIQPEFKSGPVEKPYVPSSYKLEEAVALVEAISGWEVQEQRTEAIRHIHNKFLFGTGKTEELKSDIQSLGDSITGVFINTPTLTPLQHRSLTGLFGKEIFDRFGIVLRIFKERAHTKEAKLQVQLAEIPYLRGKLFEELEETGGFEHQRGGTGKMGGGGETSVMTMKKTLNRQQKHLRKELEEIHSRHKNEREHRVKHAGLPIVSVIGYTNAGKTTLIKALSHDETMSPEDKLFATLDTTMHAGKLPCGLKVLFVDTIGFISDLPHELVESFASTLEDVINADVLVHLTDMSHPQAYAQRANVLKVLSQLNPKQQLLDNMINVLNKADKMMDTTDLSVDSIDSLLISATRGDGIKELQEKVQEAVLVSTNRKHLKITLPAAGPQLSWLHHSDHATVLEVSVLERNTDTPNNSLEVTAILSEASIGKFRAKFGDSLSINSNID